MQVGIRGGKYFETKTSCSKKLKKHGSFYSNLVKVRQVEENQRERVSLLGEIVN